MLPALGGVPHPLRHGVLNLVGNCLNLVKDYSDAAELPSKAPRAKIPSRAESHPRHTEA
jgi:hypothetical protein